MREERTLIQRTLGERISNGVKNITTKVFDGKALRLGYIRKGFRLLGGAMVVLSDRLDSTNEGLDNTNRNVSDLSGRMTSAEGRLDEVDRLKSKADAASTRANAATEAVEGFRREMKEKKPGDGLGGRVRDLETNYDELERGLRMLKQRLGLESAGEQAEETAAEPAPKKSTRDLTELKSRLGLAKPQPSEDKMSAEEVVEPEQAQEEAAEPVAVQPVETQPEDDLSKLVQDMMKEEPEDSKAEVPDEQDGLVDVTSLLKTEEAEIAQEAEPEEAEEQEEEAVSEEERQKVKELVGLVVELYDEDEDVKSALESAATIPETVELLEGGVSGWYELDESPIPPDASLSEKLELLLNAVNDANKEKGDQ